MGRSLLCIPRRERAPLGLHAHGLVVQPNALQAFFKEVGKTPENVSSKDVFGYAQGIGLSGKPPSSVTVGARIACLSSFFRFLIRMQMLTANPCEALERPKTVAGVPKGMSR